MERSDFFGQELEIGDYVLTSTTAQHSRAFILGTIKAFTPKMVTCEKVLGNDFKCYANQLVKLEPELVTLKLLKGNQ